MSNISSSEDVGIPSLTQKDSIKPTKSNHNLQSETSDRNRNSVALKQLNFSSLSVNSSNKLKKNPLVPSLSIQSQRSPSPPVSINLNRGAKNAIPNNSKNRHLIQKVDTTIASPSSVQKNSSNQQQQSQQENPSERSKVPAPPIPRLNMSSMSRSFQSLNLNRAPIPPMNIGLGSLKTMSGFNLDLPEEYSSKNVNRPVLICIPWTTIPTSADHVNKNYNINNNIRSENAYTPRSHKKQDLSITPISNNNNNNNSESNIDDFALNELINSTFYSNRISSTPDVLPDTVIIEEEEVPSNSPCTSTCSSSRNTSPASSASSPSSAHSANYRHSLKLSKVNLNQGRSNSNTSSPRSESQSQSGFFLQRAGSMTMNSPKPFNFLSSFSGGTSSVVSEVSSDSIPSLQAIDSAYQKVQHFPSLIEQTNSESTHLTTFIESILNEIEACRNEREKLRVQNEVMRSNINHLKEEIQIFNDSQQKMKQMIDGFQKLSKKSSK